MESNQNENVISIENEMELNVNEMNIEKEIVGFFFKIEVSKQNIVE